ncbi:hypothetical protein ACWD48_05815 [Streptomyces sp. NPDC002519]
MRTNRAFRISSAIVLAVLAAVVAVGPRHVTDHRVEAGDTTWAIPADGTGAGAAANTPDDTTW